MRKNISIKLFDNKLIIVFIAVIMYFTYASIALGQIMNMDSVFTKAQTLSLNDRIETYLELTKNDNLRIAQKLRLADSAVNLSIIRKDKNLLFKSYYAKANALVNQNQFDLAHESLSIAEKYLSKGDLKQKANINFTLGKIYSGWHQYDSAIDITNKGLELVLLLDDSLYIRDAYTHLGICYLNSTDYHKAIDAYNKSLEYNTTLKSDNHYFNAYSGIGICYSIMGDNIKALQYLIRAIDYKDCNVINLGKIYNSIAIIYSKTKNYEKALEYFNESMKYLKTMGDSAKISGSYTNLSNIYILLGDTLKAIENIQLSFNYNLNSEVLYALACINLANIYKNLNFSDSALSYYDKGENILTKLGNDYYLASLYFNKSDYYLKLGNYDKGVSFLSLAENKAIKLQTQSLIVKIYFQYYLLYKKKNNYKIALDYYEKHTLLKDSIYSVEHQNEIEELRTKYEASEKEEQNKLLNHKLIIEKQLTQQKTTKNRIYVLLMSLLLIFIFSFLWIIRLRTKKLIYFRELNKANKIIYEQNYKIIKQEQLIDREKNKVLTTQLESKTIYAEAIAAQLLKNSELIKLLLKRLNNLNPLTNTEGKKIIRHTRADLSGFSVMNNWNMFYKDFVSINPDFFQKLEQLSIKFSDNEMKMVCFIKIGLKTKQIASITFQSVNSINVAKTRLRKKLGVADNDGLQKFFANL